MQKKIILFNDLVTQWILEIRKTHALSTYAKYRQLSINHILPYFENLEIHEMTQSLLESFRQYLLNESGKKKVGAERLSNGNLNCIVMIMNSVLLRAYHKQQIPQLLAISLKMGRNKHIVHVFSTEEQKLFEEYLLDNLSLSTLGIYLCLYTGLRLGEICSLKWEDINLEREYLYIRHTVQRLPSNAKEPEEATKTKLVVTAPKSTSSLRMVPLPSFLIHYFYSFVNKFKQDVFFLTGTYEPMEPRTFQYQYKKYLKEAKLSYLNFHTLRHTFATRCITLGIDPKTLSEILGHADIKITLEYYFHASFEFKKTQIERLCSLS